MGNGKRFPFHSIVTVVLSASINLACNVLPFKSVQECNSLNLLHLKMHQKNTIKKINFMVSGVLRLSFIEMYS